MAMTLIERLRKLSDGSRTPHMKELDQVRKDLLKLKADLASLVDELEINCEQADEATDQLVSTETPRDERPGLWEEVRAAAGEAIITLGQICAASAPGDATKTPGTT